VLSLDLLGAGILRGQQPHARHRGRGLVGAFVEHLGDPEVQQLRHPFRGHQDVERLDVPVHHQALVRVAHGAADLEEKLESLLHRERPAVGPGIDRLALDVLHGEERHTLVRAAAVQEAGDVGVVQRGEDLALGPEAREHLLGVHAALDDLERDPVLVLAVRALGEVDGAHPSPPQLTHHPVGAHEPSDPALVALGPFTGGRDRGCRDEVTGSGVRGEKALDVRPELRIVGAAPLEEGLALVLPKRRRLVEQLLAPKKPSVAHRGDPAVLSPPEPSTAS
jgi:hypothetical protein